MSARQFDVFPNPDPESAAAYPYFLVLQHDVLRDLNTRLVAPLIPPKRLPDFDRLMPAIAVKGSRYVLDVTGIGEVPTRILENPVANFEEARYEIISALDLVFTGI